jgi:hypothetical protein
MQLFWLEVAARGTLRSLRIFWPLRRHQINGRPRVKVLRRLVVGVAGTFPSIDWELEAAVSAGWAG